MKSMLDRCDDCDSDEPLDLLELTLDMACPPWVAEAAVLEADQFPWESTRVPRGVAWPDVKMNSSASPEWADPLSEKS